MGDAVTLLAGQRRGLGNNFRDVFLKADRAQIAACLDKVGVISGA